MNYHYKLLYILLSVSSYATCILAKQKAIPVQLDEDTWPELLHGEWLVKFYAPWCPACRAMASVWEDVAGWSDDLDIKVAKIDVTDNPGLSGRFLVTSLPSIYHVNDGEFRVYRGSRSENDIVSYVDDEKWKESDPVPWYIKPTSIHMSTLGMFFKLSMSIRDLHNKMTTDYGIPVWGSYTIFAVATIILGLLLGLLLVFLCDCMLPSNHPQPTYMSMRPGQEGRGPQSGDKEDTDSDSIEDDLQDDLPERDVSEADNTNQSDIRDQYTELPRGGDTVRPKTARKRVKAD